MATNFDKSMYVLPEEGISDDQTPVLDIEIVDDDAPQEMAFVLNEDGSVSEEQAGLQPAVVDTGHDANLALTLDPDVLLRLSQDLLEDIAQDLRDREDWEKTMADGVKLLGIKNEEKTKPWKGACSINHPILLEAVVRFQSETTSATFPAEGPTKTKVLGKETQDKLEAAQRVRQEMNYQLTEVMPEFRDEHEQMLFNLPAFGSAFKLNYRDADLGRTTSMFIPAEEIILPHGCTNIRTCERVTRVLRYTQNKLEALKAAGFYADVPLPEITPSTDMVTEAKDDAAGVDGTMDDRPILYEVRWRGVIEGDERPGMPRVGRQYMITIEKSTGKVLAVRRNWREGDTKERRKQDLVHYKYVPGFGPYGFGLINLIGAFAKGSTAILQQLVDAGTLANLSGGFKTKGTRIMGGDKNVAPGEFIDVETGGESLKDSLVPLPYKEPSAVLSGLLEKIVAEGRRLAAQAEIKFNDISSQTPVGTLMALLERELVVLSAVQARVHKSLGEELKILKELIALDEESNAYPYSVGEGQFDRAQDFALVDVVPVSDPNASTLTQKLVQYQSVIQLSQTAPQVYDMPRLHRGMLHVLGIKDADKLVPMEDDLKPLDPVSENQRVLTGKPVKAFIEQDHMAHIATHQAAMQDPLIAQMVGQSPNAAAIQAAAMAHLMEHTAMLYRLQVQAHLGAALPAYDEDEPQEMEPALAAKVAQLIAQAAQKQLAQSQAIAAAQQAEQAAQDPYLQMQMKELQLKELKEQREMLKVQIQAASAADKQQLEERKAQMENQIEMLRLSIDAAARTEKAQLDERKQTAAEELGEQNVALKAMHFGMMGRAQDQQILQDDRRLALEERQSLREEHARNDLGESRKERDE